MRLGHTGHAHCSAWPRIVRGVAGSARSAWQVAKARYDAEADLRAAREAAAEAAAAARAADAAAAGRRLAAALVIQVRA